MAAEVTIRLDVDSSAAMQKIQNLIGHINKIGSTASGKATGGVATGVSQIGTAAVATTDKVATLGKSMSTAKGRVLELVSVSGASSKELKKSALAAEQLKGDAGELAREIVNTVRALGRQRDGLLYNNAALVKNGDSYEQAANRIRIFAQSLKGRASGALIHLQQLLAKGEIDATTFGTEFLELQSIIDTTSINVDELGKVLANESKLKKASEDFTRKLTASEFEYAKAVKKSSAAAAKSAAATANLVKKRQGELVGQGKGAGKEYADLEQVRRRAEKAAEDHAKAAKAEAAALRELEKVNKKLQGAKRVTEEMGKGQEKNRDYYKAVSDEMKLLNATREKLIASGHKETDMYEQTGNRLEELKTDLGQVTPETHILTQKIRTLGAELNESAESVKKASKNSRKNSEELKLAERRYEDVGQAIRTMGDQDVARLRNHLVSLGPDGKKSLDMLERELRELGTAAHKSQQGLAHLGRVQSHASVSLLDMSRIAEDSAYGFRGMANNIVPAIQSFNRLKETAGGMRGAFQGLVKGLIGPGGLFVAIGLLTTILLKSGDAWKKLFFSEEDIERMRRVKDALQQAKEAVKALAEELETLEGREGLTDAAMDFEEAVDRQTGKIEKLNNGARQLSNVAGGMSGVYADFQGKSESLLFSLNKVEPLFERLVLMADVAYRKGIGDFKLDSTSLDALTKKLDEAESHAEELANSIKILEDAGQKGTEEHTRLTKAWNLFISAASIARDRIAEVVDASISLNEALSAIDIEDAVSGLTNLEKAEKVVEAYRSQRQELLEQAQEYRRVIEEEERVRSAANLPIEEATEREKNYREYLKLATQALNDNEAALRRRIRALAEQQGIDLRNQEFQEILDEQTVGNIVSLDGTVSKIVYTGPELETLDDIENLDWDALELDLEIIPTWRMDLEGMDADFQADIRAFEQQFKDEIISEEQLNDERIALYRKKAIALSAAIASGNEAAKDEIIAFKAWLAENGISFESLFSGEIGGDAMTRLEKWMENFEQIKEIAQQTTGIISQLWSNAHQRRLNEINAEKQAITERYAAELDNERLTDAMRKTIEKRREKEMKKIAEKEKELREKQARQQKAQAIFAAIINTSEAVTKALAQGGFIAGIPMSTIIAALGAAQVAAIAAAPIPSFEAGVTNFSGGIARVHQDEMLVNLPARTNVITNENVERLAALNTSPVAPSINDEAANEIRLEQLNRTEALLEAVVEQTERLERARASIDIRELEETITRFQYEEGR